jgi:hypothetical protein
MRLGGWSILAIANSNGVHRNKRYLRHGAGQHMVTNEA